ncbi:NAD(P)/FAD-dependent oxidoreductase [Streptosporangium sp. NPDC002524]|uniref:FAD-dependent oxidoreductase n=1 Tax=Streptosporangium sp. NPDC002524 TaxID=3154537 RepID=UPI0033299F42
MRVLIIGAGIGGLCLAHGLRRAGIDVEVLERTGAGTPGLAGYGIHINANGGRALRECLPEENWARFKAIAPETTPAVRFSDEHLRTLSLVGTRPGTDPAVVQRRAVNRLDLRDVLLHGLTDDTSGTSGTSGGVVRWNREFARYTHTSDGRVRAHFTDGGHTDGDLLVGADGANSRVRGQYLPHLGRMDTGVLNIAGRVPLTPRVSTRLPAWLIDGSVNNIVPNGPGWMFVSAWHTPIQDAPAGQIVWAYAAARDSYPGNVLEMEPAALRDLVVARTEGWLPDLRALVAGSDPAGVTALRLRCMPALAPWPAGDVTLLGDAIHNMTPMAGVGANTALRDALTLCRVLEDAGTRRSGLLKAVSAYEREMRGYANHALGLSLRNARNAASEARLPRIAFRAALRVAELVPPVKRVMFADHHAVAAGRR